MDAIQVRQGYCFGGALACLAASTYLFLSLSFPELLAQLTQPAPMHLENAPTWQAAR